MKFLLLPIVIWTGFCAPCLAETPSPEAVKGKDIAPEIKLVVRELNGEKLTPEEHQRVSVMVAYIKGFTDGLHPMQVLFPQGPISIPEKVTMGQFAKNLDDYLKDNPDALNDPTSLVLFNCAFIVYKNPNFIPALMPRKIPMPELKTKP